MALRKAILLLALLCLLPVPAHASEEAEEAARQVWSDISERGIAAMADHLHPASGELLKDVFLPIAEMAYEHGEGAEFSRQLLGEERSLEEVQALGGVEFFRAFLSAIEGMMGSLGQFRFDELEVLGSIAEGEVQHVLARMRVGVGEFSVRQVEVLSMRQWEGSWRMQLTAEIEGMALMMRQAFEEGLRRAGDGD